MKKWEIDLQQNLSELYKGSSRNMDETVYFFSSGERVYSIVEMDEQIRDRMSAIDIAARLLGRQLSYGEVFIESSCTVARMRNPKVKTLSFSNYYRMVVETPTFLWSMKRDGGTDHFVMGCEEDFTLKFPVQIVKVGPFKTIKEEIGNVEMFLSYLDDLMGAFC